MKVRLFTLVVLLIVAFTAVVGGTYYFLNGQDENSLNITEKEFMERLDEYSHILCKKRDAAEKQYDELVNSLSKVSYRQ